MFSGITPARATRKRRYADGGIPEIVQAEITPVPFFRLLPFLLAIFLACAAHGQTYWLNSQYDTASVHYPTAEEACISGELQRRLDIRQSSSALPHRYAQVHIGADYDIGERTCNGVIQRQQFNQWLPVEVVSVSVYGPLGQTPDWPDCPLDGTSDADTGQCLIPKCDSDCPVDGGNPSNPVASASGNKRQRETDYSGAGLFPLTFTRTWNSARITGNQTLPLGAGWTHNYAARLVPIVDGSGQITRIRAYRPNGAIQLFTYANGQWQGDADVPERLAVTLANGLLQSASYRRRDDRIETYNRHGRLTRIQNSDGHEQTLQYANGSSQPHTITDPQGRTLHLAWNSAGQLINLTASDGSTINYQYDANDQLANVTYPDTTTRQYHRGETFLAASVPGNVPHPQLLTGITGETGQRIATWAYDERQRALLSVHGAHNAASDRTTFQYNADGSTHITDSLGQTRHYQFSASHGSARLAALDVPCDTCANTAKSKTYDSNGYPQTSTDFDGNLTQYLFDAAGRQTQKTQAAGTAQQRRIETDWLPGKNKATQQRTYDANNTLLHQSSYSRNSRGQPLNVTQTDPQTNQNRSTGNSYCETTGNACPFIGLLKTRTDAAGNITTYSYYAADGTYWRKGDLHTITNALGHTSEYLRYDGAGRPLRVQDADGLITEYSYHPRGWLQSITHSASGADARTTTIDYLHTGEVENITWPDASWLRYGYDAIGRLIRITDNQANTIHYTLDSAGNRIQEHIRDSNNALPYALARQYSLLGRLQTITDAASASTHYQYSPDGLPAKTTDALGHITQYSHDPLQRLQKTMRDANGIAAEAKHQYNALNQKTKTTDPKSLATNYSYNALGDLLQENSPDSGTTTWTYDSAGRKSSETHANGNTAHYSYDALNRITAITYPASPALDISYYYDSAPAVCAANENWHTGRLARITDHSGSTQYCYNAFGQITRKVQTTAGQTYTLRYRYEADGQLRDIQYPDGAWIDHQYDSMGRIREIGASLPGQPRQIVVANVEYAPFGPPIQWQYGNGRNLTRTLDQNYRPQSILDSTQDGLSLHYTHDAAGNITALHTISSQPLAQLQYDGLDRITGLQDGSGTAQHSYTWDETGNRTGYTDSSASQSYSYPADSHRLASINTTNRNYDAAGNTTANGAGAQYFYDARNRLSAVENGASSARYRYNAWGERVWRETATAKTASVYLEDGRWLGEYDTHHPIQQIIWLGNHPVAVLDYSGNARPLHYIESDHLGTPRVVIEQDRNLAVWIWPIAGEAFGNTPPKEDPDGDGTNFTLDMRFPGQRYDSVSGLYYNYFREYEPGTGRYTQSDPIGLAGGLATYEYAYGNPGRYIDPRGLHPAAIPVAACLRSPACVGPIVISCQIVWENLRDNWPWTASSAGGKDTNPPVPPLPTDLVGDQSNPNSGPNKDGSRHTSGPLKPEYGGTGDFLADLEKLTGGIRPVRPDERRPPGSLIGENGIFGRPENSNGGSSIDIPANGSKPHETLHYP